MGAATFDELPEVCDDDEVRRIHRTSGPYFLNQSGVAHGDMSCMFLDGVRLVANPRWRIATDAECRHVGAHWCDDCCGV